MTMLKNDQAIQASEEFIHDLSAAVGDVHFDRMTRLLYSTDASIYQMMPIGVALPRNSEEIIAAIEIAGQHGVPVLPRGGGSSLAGQTVGHALVLDCSRYMDQVLDINTEAMTVRVQPGITLGTLNLQLAKHGVQYGPDPASAERATMGGIVANNSTGAHSIVYGMTVDHVIAADVVLSDASHVTFDSFSPDEWPTRAARSGIEGQVYATLPGILDRHADQIATRYPNTFRTASGYNLNYLAQAARPNLTQLICGSEGTLGMITEATLNIVPKPQHTRLAMVHFADLRAALEAVPVILESDPTAVEVLDKMLLDLTRDRVEYRRLLTFVEGDPEVVLLVEYTGESDAHLDAGIDRLRRQLNTIHHNQPVVIVSDPTQQANVWYVRKVGLGILMSIRGDAKPIPFIEDAAVPVEHLADYVTTVIDFCEGVGVDRVAMYAHASAGCIHVRPLVNLKQAQGVRQLRAIAEESARLAVQYGGTTSGEHGEGLVRGEFSELLFGPELVKAFEQVKDTFDPHGIMNPGKVVNCPPMDDESLLRYGSDYATPHAPSSTVFSFAADEGFTGAVEMCNGAGVCRKLEHGVMCPSFMATRDEAHSTRGRANALRAAMMGLLGTDGMSSREVYDVLDLCLSCKACKSECPSSVDMAKLKAEFLHTYHEEHGTPLRSRVFGSIAGLNRLAQPFAPLANAALRGPGKWALTALGVHPDRTLPAFARQPFSRWFKQTHNGAGAAPTSRRQVVFFHDTFTEHNDPHIGQAAIEVLEAAGIEPILVEKRECCGRPALSKGLLQKAKRMARHNIDLLAPYAKRGIPIVGLEPSCLSMLSDDYPDLVPGADAQTLAQLVKPIDQYLVEMVSAGHITLDFDDTPRRVLFHGHCQQKAVFGAESTLDMLRLIPNCEAEMVESSCCGMAGSFGYEEEHYDLSIKLAERDLAPAVRAAAGGTIITAMGTSCRDQIEHTTERAAIHPIEMLADALKR